MRRETWSHLDIHVEDEDQGENGDALIVEGACDRSGNVGRHYGDEGGRDQSRTLAPHLLHEEVGGQGAEGREQWSCEDAHLRPAQQPS